MASKLMYCINDKLNLIQSKSTIITTKSQSLHYTPTVYNLQQIETTKAPSKQELQILKPKPLYGKLIKHSIKSTVISHRMHTKQMQSNKAQHNINTYRNTNQTVTTSQMLFAINTTLNIAELTKNNQTLRSLRSQPASTVYATIPTALKASNINSQKLCNPQHFNRYHTHKVQSQLTQLRKSKQQNLKYPTGIYTYGVCATLRSQILQATLIVSFTTSHNNVLLISASKLAVQNNKQHIISPHNRALQTRGFSTHNNSVTANQVQHSSTSYNNHNLAPHQSIYRHNC
eukprot:gene2755-1740_t